MSTEFSAKNHNNSDFLSSKGCFATTRSKQIQVNVLSLRLWSSWHDRSSQYVTVREWLLRGEPWTDSRPPAPILPRICAAAWSMDGDYRGRFHCHCLWEAWILRRQVNYRALATAKVPESPLMQRCRRSKWIVKMS